MSQTLDRSPHTLQEACYALSVAQEVPDAKLLDDVVRRYPQFSEELTEFAIALAIDALRGDGASEAAEEALDPEVVSPAVSRAMSHFHNRLHAITAGTRNTATRTGGATTKVEVASNPFQGLSRPEFRALAEALNVNTVFLSKLRDRLIDPRTMSPGFRRHVANKLRAPEDVVIAHFEARQEAPVRQYFKADDKPSGGLQQSFEAAVKSSGLSESQQKLLLEL